jgi:hypothetical protein
MLICKEWQAVGSKWRLLRAQYSAWYYLERDGAVTAESGDRRVLLSQGWFK